MVAHVVLFRPRADLAPAEREHLAAAFSEAIATIPTIRRCRVGRRVTHGRPYEGLMREDLQFAVLLEFDDVAGLKAYLEHPAHERLGQLFFAAFETALMYDYEIEESPAGIL